MQSFIEILKNGSKDILGTISPGIFGAVMIYGLLFPTLPKLDNLPTILFLVVLIALILNVLNPIIISKFQKIRLISKVVNQSEFVQLERDLKNRKIDREIIQKLKKAYEIQIDREMQTYHQKIKNLRYNTNKDSYDINNIDALISKEIKLINYSSLLLISILLTVTYLLVIFILSPGYFPNQELDPFINIYRDVFEYLVVIIFIFALLGIASEIQEYRRIYTTLIPIIDDNKNTIMDINNRLNKVKAYNLEKTTIDKIEKEQVKKTNVINLQRSLLLNTLSDQDILKSDLKVFNTINEEINKEFTIILEEKQRNSYELLYSEDPKNQLKAIEAYLASNSELNLMETTFDGKIPTNSKRSILESLYRRNYIISESHYKNIELQLKKEPESQEMYLNLLKLTRNKNVEHLIWDLYSSGFLDSNLEKKPEILIESLIKTHQYGIDAKWFESSKFVKMYLQVSNDIFEEKSSLEFIHWAGYDQNNDRGIDFKQLINYLKLILTRLINTYLNDLKISNLDWILQLLVYSDYKHSSDISGWMVNELIPPEQFPLLRTYFETIIPYMKNINIINITNYVFQHGVKEEYTRSIMERKIDNFLPIFTNNFANFTFREKLEGIKDPIDEELLNPKRYYEITQSPYNQIIQEVNQMVPEEQKILPDFLKKYLMYLSLVITERTFLDRLLNIIKLPTIHPRLKYGYLLARSIYHSKKNDIVSAKSFINTLDDSWDYTDDSGALSKSEILSIIEKESVES